MEVTSIGPVDPKTRDELKDYRDRENYPNYNEALKALLSDQGV